MRSKHAEAEVFGRENYKSYIYLNLFKNPEYKQIFEGDLEPDEIYKRISLLVKNVKFIEGDTLIFIDEIQACNKARTALKFLATDDKYDIVASGFLLGLLFGRQAKNSCLLLLDSSAASKGIFKVPVQDCREKR